MKKIGFLLATIMIFAAMPVLTAQAASPETRLYGGDNYWVDKTLSFRSSEPNQLSIINNGKLSPVYRGDVDFTIGGRSVRKAANGLFLRVQNFTPDIASFKLRLTGNAVFMFAEGLMSDGVSGYTFPNQPGTDTSTTRWYYSPVGSSDSNGIFNRLTGYTRTGVAAYTIQTDGPDAYITLNQDFLDAAESSYMHSYALEIPLAIYMDEVSDVYISLYEAYDNEGSDISSGDLNVSRKLGGGYVSCVGYDIVSGINSAKINDIFISESIRDTVKAGGTLELTLTEGFVFDYQNMNVLWHQRFSVTANPNYFFDKNYEILYIEIPPHDASITGNRSFYLKGLAIKSKGTNPNAKSDVYLTIDGSVEDLISLSASTPGYGSNFGERSVDSNGNGSFVAKNAGFSPKSISIAVLDSTLVLGDANTDGVVNLKDATMISRYYAHFPDAHSKLNTAAADANKDDVIDLKDATLVSRYFAGFPDAVDALTN